MIPDPLGYAASALSGPLLLILAGFGCLLLPIFLKQLRGAQGLIALGAVLVLITFFRRAPSAELAMFNGALLLSPLSAYLWAFSLAVLLLIIIISIARPPAPEESQGEYYFLLFMATIGLMVLVAAGDLFTAFIALELLSLPVYVLAGIRRSKPGIEAAYKYFMLGAFGSGVTIMGIAMLNAVYPALTFAALKTGAPGPFALAGFLLVISGFAFKTALVPFHMWVPDAYEGAPTQVSAFMAAAVKTGGVVVLWKLFSLFDGGPVHQIFWWLAVITAVSANLMALAQKGVKRLLAYSSVAHAGYLAVAFFGGRQGFEAVLYYLPVYAMATIGAFSVALLLEKEEKGPLIEDLAGLAKSRPWLAAAMAAFMFSLAGVPPLAGFFAKFYAFAGAVNSGYTGLVIIAILMSAVSIYYYLKVTVVMFMKPAAGELPAKAPGLIEAVIFLMAAGVILAGVFSRPLLALAAEASRWF
ncbi:MAG: NADH-quinone oxidoreductase subunit N [Elusimicrobia bacterium CG_4_10_14_0_2_um_filter_56_8]|nr:MAG: NADH-quinone oxidoreductase subunit N [Elusimicrobia bacterium CG_4_10_14_0_2_um_filter_56_8]